jgi:hypothetical protein
LGFIATFEQRRHGRMKDKHLHSLHGCSARLFIAPLLNLSTSDALLLRHVRRVLQLGLSNAFGARLLILSRQRFNVLLLREVSRVFHLGLTDPG